jgi:small subunit ribosomal protein S6
MAKLPTIYDLVLVLSMDADDEARQRIVAEVESAIEQAGGRVERKQSWGRRPLAYEIAHQPEGEYHLLQFAGPPSLLESLRHTLRIDPNVLRSRIIKVLAGQPPAPESPPPVVAGASAAPGAAASGAGASGGEEAAAA